MTDTGAVFSDCRTWRYVLWRVWDDDKPEWNFIGLNPSTADETKDDPTIRRCITFAKREGAGGIYMTNIFAFRATDPKTMKDARDPVGPENEKYLSGTNKLSSKSIACWGAHGGYQNQGSMIRGLLYDLWCFGLTKQGYPKHPLYLRADTELEKL